MEKAGTSIILYILLFVLKQKNEKKRQGVEKRTETEKI